ncbi:hypothetical protein KR009_009745 [Drosophila setifemur]|nr:hypothetical protein KR009_009745 [Drosophila setifemur]
MRIFLLKIPQVCFLLGLLMVAMELNMAQGLRMKRSQTKSTTSGFNNTATANVTGMANAPTERVAIINTTTAGTTSTTTSTTTPEMNATTTSKQKITATAVPKQTTLVEGTSSTLESPPELIEDLRRPKRRLDVDADNLVVHKSHHKRHHSMAAGGSTTTSDPLAAAAAAAVPPPPSPFVYYNKMISPDGKHEVKEFELLAPNMMIESVQQELNYGPEVLPPELAGVLLMNAAENSPHGGAHSSGAGKHHHKHKSSPALTPMLYMLQQLLQPPSFEGNVLIEPPKDTHRRLSSSPLYQFLDGAMDLALRSNQEVEHFLGDRLEIEHDKEKMTGKDKLIGKKAKKDNALKELFVPKESKDELLVSCPIHHERHPNRNGEMVEDDVVLVNECHLL